eukprot:TRINITY_DN35569_c0_g1_i1.p3 TRINITY_DN35569_c0_g1~~TRINITY_DN35569_c0_g1_i1.p3  ORF type:complete len:133 (-),score=24.79 TRINITY_DN35569_c0_g1_i1:264-662(-)
MGQTTDDIKGQFNNFGRNCLYVQKQEITNDNSMMIFLLNQLENGKQFKQIMNSPFIIKDQIRLWDGLRDITYFDPYLIRFHLLDKYSSNTCIIENNASYKPHITCFENTKKIIFQYNGDIFADIEQELQIVL